MTKVDTPKQYTNTQSSHRDQQHKENRDAITKNKTTRHEEDIVNVAQRQKSREEQSFQWTLVQTNYHIVPRNTKHKTQNTKHRTQNTQNTKHKTQKSRPFLIKVLQGRARERRKEPTQKQHTNSTT